jgi:anti-sigma B factor antagonist
VVAPSRYVGGCAIAAIRPVVVKAPAELDAVSASQFRDQLALLLSQGAQSLVVDMSDVTFVDSTGMGALVGARKLALERGGDLTLQGVAANVAASLRYAGLSVHLGVQRQPD